MTTRDWDDIDIPKPFTGTKEELEANIASHDWVRFDGETRCGTCEARRYGGVAMWPCGREERLRIPKEEADTPEARAVLAAALKRVIVAAYEVIDEEGLE